MPTKYPGGAAEVPTREVIQIITTRVIGPVLLSVEDADGVRARGCHSF